MAKEGLKNCEIVLNLTDQWLAYRNRKSELEQYVGENHYKRIYIGSYFCEHYFLKGLAGELGWMSQLQKNCQIAVTLVVPILPQSTLEKGKEGLERLFTKMPQRLLKTETMSEMEKMGILDKGGVADGFPCIDEVVVNDIGMLYFLRELRQQYRLSIRIIAGRLLSKNYRDIRYPEYIQGTRTVFFPEWLKGEVDAVEIDVISESMDLQQIPKALPVHLHVPYTYVTCGQLCEYAAVANTQNIGRQTNHNCGEFCSTGYMQTKTDECTLLHIGKAVYASNPDLKKISRMPSRTIYWRLG